MRRRVAVGALVAGIAGAVLGAGSAAGAALLLYAGQGALATAGFLVALVLAAVGAALWVGPAEGPPGPARGRWLIAAVAYIAAGPFAQLWSGSAALRAAGWGRALAVLLFLAAPAYGIGAVLAALHARGRGIAPAALAGAAIGVLAAGAVLIPKLDPNRLYFIGALALVAASMVEAAWAGSAAPTGEGGAMEGKVVIITGVGARGQLGYALAEAFLGAGAKVVLTDVRPEVEGLARELATGTEVVGIAADLTRAEEAERVVAAAREAFGRVDALVNATGGLTVVAPLAATEPEAWDREIERNARTAFLMCRAALPALRESRGAIVNFASPAAIRGGAGIGAYSAAKAAVVAMTRALALEERANGVRVNAVAPGMIDTEQNHQAVEDPASVKWVTREEVARVVVFLASDASAGISGETIQVLGEGLE